MNTHLKVFNFTHLRKVSFAKLDNISRVLGVRMGRYCAGGGQCFAYHIYEVGNSRE